MVSSLSVEKNGSIMAFEAKIIKRKSEKHKGEQDRAFVFADFPD